VNALWPKDVPPLTGDEALRAFRKLFRFAFHRMPWHPVRLTSGNRRTGRHGEAWLVNPEGGWRHLVHVLSHYAERSGHNGKHARMEMRMIKEVLKRGWLNGTLKPAPKQPPPVIDQKMLRRNRALAAVQRWERKLKFAQTMLKKARRRAAYYQREVTA